MNSPVDICSHDQFAAKQQSLFAIVAIFVAVLLMLSLAGCAGVAGAGTPAASSNPVTSGTLAVSATNVAFGGVKVGGKSVQTVTLTNTGKSTVTISQASITGSSFTIVGAMTSIAIPAGQQQAIQIQFSPAAPGTATGSVAVTSDASDAAVAIVLTGDGMSGLAITAQPTNQSAVVGHSATFSVTATGTGTLAYQWSKNAAAISGATASSYTTPVTASSDNNASFSVVVTDSTGNVTSNAATLMVTASAVAPSITAQPANQSVAVGQSATFSVTSAGTSPLTYQWTKNGTAISGATAASYSTPATAGSDNGATFAVTVTNSTGTVTSSAAMLTVTVPPSITGQPVNQTVNAGQTASFSVTATGSGTLTYQWKKNGTAIGGSTSASYTTPATVAGDSGSLFTVTVTSSAGSVTSNAATLTINGLPTITAQPASQSVTTGKTATFSVTANGTGTLTYQWNKNGAAISGATAASYTTPATVVGDNGTLFSVTVTANSGSVTSNAATLTVTAAAVAPSITTQPVNQSAIAGQTATFSVVAAGTATLTYQWNKNGTAIGGATASSYTTPATATSDNNAQFTVSVTNGTGNVTSSAATLTVTAATLVLNASQNSLAFASVNVGSNNALPVTFTNSGNSNVTISNVSIAGAGFTASGVSSGQIVAPGKTATLNVTFAPAAAGSVSGASVTVVSNAANSPTTISLTGTGVQTVSHSVTLTWQASGSTVSGYNVYRSTVTGGPYTKVNTSIISTTSYTDSTVQSGQTYFYVVTSVDSTGAESTYSAEVTAKIP